MEDRTPHDRRRKGRPQQSWKNQVMEFMRSKNTEEDMTEDGHIWRYIYIYIFKRKLIFFKQKLMERLTT